MTNILIHKAFHSSYFLSQRFFFQVPNEETTSCCHLRVFLPPQDTKENKSSIFKFLKLLKIKPKVILLTGIRENRGQPSLSNSIEFAIPQVLFYLETLLNNFTNSDFANCIFVEHYSNFSYNDYNDDFENFWLVKLNSKLAAPEWRSISHSDLSLIIRGNFKGNGLLNSFLLKNWNPWLMMNSNEILLQKQAFFDNSIFE